MATIAESIQEALEKQRAGSYQEAETLYRQILAQDPSNPEAHYHIGVLANQLGQPLMAVQWLEKAVELNPANPQFLSGLGYLYQVLSEDEKAIATYQRVLTLGIGDDGIYFNLGLVYHRSGKYIEAGASYQQAISLNPNVAEVYFYLGLAYEQLKKWIPAMEAYEAALQLKPDDAETYFHLADILQQMEEQKYSLPDLAQSGMSYLEQAVQFYLIGLSFNPSDASATFNLANAYLKLEKLDDARIYYEKTLEINPSSVVAYNNLGLIQRALMNLDKAIACYHEALKLDPNHAEAHYNLSTCYLLQGRFEEGWRHYEWRDYKKFLFQNSPKPVWNGEPIEGKTLLVRFEQGYGDTFQFIRYLPMVKALGATILFEYQEGLARILKDFDGIDQLIRKGDAELHNIPYDYQISLLTLPFIFNTRRETIPSQIPYLYPLAETVTHWQERLKADKGLKIAIAWEGTISKPSFLKRACPLKYFEILAGLPDISLYSIQKGAPVQQLKENAFLREKIVDLSGDLGDFADTSGALACMDLVICIDTGIAHLAAGMGKSVWLLLPYICDWRWMLEGETSPWYPTMRLFRQPSYGDWQSVFEKVCKTLESENLLL